MKRIAVVSLLFAMTVCAGWEWQEDLSKKNLGQMQQDGEFRVARSSLKCNKI